jgi:DNA-binding Lrp family transcriptional regulator
MAKIDSTHPGGRPPTETAGPRLSQADVLHKDLSTAVIVFHEAVARRLGMTAGDRKCLQVLCELGETTPKRLAEATGLSTGAVTGVLDRLEKSGHAERRPNPDDRRSLLVRPLNIDGVMEVLIPAFASLSEAMAELSARYTPEQLAMIHAYLAETTQVLKSQTEKLERETQRSGTIRR